MDNEKPNKSKSKNSHVIIDMVIAMTIILLINNDFRLSEKCCDMLLTLRSSHLVQNSEVHTCQNRGIILPCFCKA